MQKSEKDYHLFDWWKRAFIDNFANFDGRARRTEYWYFTLGNIILFIPLYVVLIFSMTSDYDALGIISMILFFGAAVALIIPSIAVTVRRLHDTNRSGWYYLLTLVPLLSIIILVFMIMPGDYGRNSYGRDPKGGYDEDGIDQIGSE